MRRARQSSRPAHDKAMASRRSQWGMNISQSVRGRCLTLARIRSFMFGASSIFRINSSRETKTSSPRAKRGRGKIRDSKLAEPGTDSLQKPSGCPPRARLNPNENPEPALDAPHGPRNMPCQLSAECHHAKRMNPITRMPDQKVMERESGRGFTARDAAEAAGEGKPHPCTPAPGASGPRDVAWVVLGIPDVYHCNLPATGKDRFTTILLP